MDSHAVAMQLGGLAVTTHIFSNPVRDPKVVGGLRRQGRRALAGGERCLGQRSGWWHAPTGQCPDGFLGETQKAASHVSRERRVSFVHWPHRLQHRTYKGLEFNFRWGEAILAGVHMGLFHWELGCDLGFSRCDAVNGQMCIICARAIA